MRKGGRIQSGHVKGANSEIACDWHYLHIRPVEIGAESWRGAWSFGRVGSAIVRALNLAPMDRMILLRRKSISASTRAEPAATNPGEAREPDYSGPALHTMTSHLRS